MVTDTRQRVTELIEAGHRLEDIEREFIDRAGWLDDEERAALWLFAWAYQDLGKAARPLEPASH